MEAVRILFPNQLFRDVSNIREPVYLVEENLLFSQYPFHKAKLSFHRASMRYYADYLERQGKQVTYVASEDSDADIRKLIISLHNSGVKCIRCEDPVDDWLTSRLASACLKYGLTIEQSPSRLFMNDEHELNAWFDGRKRYFQTDFYIHQRKSRGILTDAGGGPAGGKWSFDAENRERWPKGRIAPVFTGATTLKWHTEADQHVSAKFKSNPGSLSSGWRYPVTHDQADEWLEEFLRERFAGFGKYEDALVRHERILHHSVLTPMLNTGLLQPGEVIGRALTFAEENHIPLNSLEGFIRQVLGWREFIRAVYIREGRMQRSCNFWGFSRTMPASFYSGTTGIAPVDTAISGLLATGYNHHIERLMVLGNFMLLCEIHPDAVYRWFMELYIDAYDWVMVPNVYGMSQFADGGLMCTKPYISGSNYLVKMSDFPADKSWTGVWDALFWRFMHVHRDFFGQNPRLGMLLRTFDKMDSSKRNALLSTADRFLVQL